MSPQQQREAIRTGVLKFLADRPALAFEARHIMERLNKSNELDFTAEPDDISDAIVFLRGSEFIKHAHHGLGATLYYQVTSAGVLAHERGTINPRPL
jgi:hypothetical protein